MRTKSNVKSFFGYARAVTLVPWNGASRAAVGHSLSCCCCCRCRYWQAGNLKEMIRVLQLKSPEVFRYWVVYQKVQSSDGSTLMLE